MTEKYLSWILFPNSVWHDYLFDYLRFIEANWNPQSPHKQRLSDQKSKAGNENRTPRNFENSLYL